MTLQIAICFMIYFIYYLIQNGNYIFSEQVINKTKEILSYDINISSFFEQSMHFIQSQIEDTNSKEDEGQEVLTNTVEEPTLLQEENGVGGAAIEDTILEEQTTDEPETDESYIKNNFSLIKPVEGTVSSEFGVRDVANPIVSKNHTGIDIAANTGTVIKASHAGKVILSSTTGDYGYHIKIQNGDLVTLYAHCSKLYVKEGEEVLQGQEIAEVGSTGKSTGPHLHFEIMRGTNYINPRNIIEF